MIIKTFFKPKKKHKKFIDFLSTAFLCIFFKRQFLIIESKRIFCYFLYKKVIVKNINLVNISSKLFLSGLGVLKNYIC